jgi:hypothetical protein
VCFLFGFYEYMYVGCIMQNEDYHLALFSFVPKGRFTLWTMNLDQGSVRQMIGC